MAGDPPTPRIDGLAGAAIGVRQRVAGGHVHEHERIEDDGIAAGLQIANGANDGIVRRRAAIGGLTRAERHHERARSRKAVNHPGVGRRHLVGDFNLRADRAGAAAQIVAEPADYQKHRIDAGQRGFEIIKRDRPVRSRAPGAVVLGRGGTAAEIALLDLGVIGALARAGDHGHGAHDGLKAIARRGGDAPEHFEGQLRQAIAELFQREIVEDHIGRAAIGGRVARSFDAFDQRIGRLARGAAIYPHGDAGEREWLAIGPDASDPVDRPLAEPDCEVRKIGIGGGSD